MKYHFKICKEKQGFSARCLELEGCVTQGDNARELQENMHEALNLYVDEPDDSDDAAPLPDRSIRCSETVVEMALAPEIARSLLQRRERLLQRFDSKKQQRQ